MNSKAHTEVHGRGSNSVIPVALSIVNHRQLTWLRNWVLTFTLQPIMVKLELNPQEIKIEKIGDQVKIT